MATACLASPDETSADLDGSVLAICGNPVVPESSYVFITSPENFTNFQIPQAGAAISFG